MRTTLHRGIWHNQPMSLIIKVVTVFWILTTGVVLGQITGSGAADNTGRDRPAFAPHGQPKTIETPSVVVPVPLPQEKPEQQPFPGLQQLESYSESEEKVRGSGLRLPDHLIDQPDSRTLVAPSDGQTPPARSEQSDSPSGDETEEGGNLRAAERLFNQPTDSRTLLNE